MRASSGDFRIWRSVGPAWVRGPTAVPCGRLLLTTESGRPQPGRRRQRPRPPHMAGSGRTRRGSSPPRHTVRRKRCQGRRGEKAASLGRTSWSSQGHSLFPQPQTHPPPFHGIFALSDILMLWLCLSISLRLSVGGDRAWFLAGNPTHTGRQHGAR